VKLPRIGAPPWDRARRRRRAPRDGAPRTIVPVAEAAARSHADEPFAARLDQARARLRAAIPPVADGDQ